MSSGDPTAEMRLMMRNQNAARDVLRDVSIAYCRQLRPRARLMVVNAWYTPLAPIIGRDDDVVVSTTGTPR